MPLKPSQIETILCRKLGFEAKETGSDDHKRYVLKLPNLPVIQTYFSHSRSEIHKGLEGKISRQLHVRIEHFRKILECSMSREEYERLLRTDPYPPFTDFELGRLSKK